MFCLKSEKRSVDEIKYHYSKLVVFLMVKSENQLFRFCTGLQRDTIFIAVRLGQ
jgi:hypothetical protein